MARSRLGAVAVFITVANGSEARRLADVLVKEKKAACVQVVGKIRSVYRWQGRLERSFEHLLIAKTQRAQFPALLALVKKGHPYAVPEVVALPIVAANPAYLSWVTESLIG